MPSDSRLFSPSAARNLAPITEVLERRLPRSGLVLEVASGPGEHVCEWARRFPSLDWQPSDVSPAALASVAARAAGSPNLRAPLLIDLASPGWERSVATAPVAIIAVNLLHIAPSAVGAGLLRGAAACLAPRGSLVVYGPFMRAGRHTAPSNAAFDESLRARDPAWGVRDLDDVEAAASRHGLVLLETCPMPANNLLVIYGRRREGEPGARSAR